MFRKEGYQIFKRQLLIILIQCTVGRGSKGEILILTIHRETGMQIPISTQHLYFAEVI